MLLYSLISDAAKHNAAVLCTQVHLTISDRYQRCGATM